MTNIKEFLLNELVEHTMDSDCAKSQHFYDEQMCRKKAAIFNRAQAIVFLLTIATYVLIVSGIKQSGWLNFLGIALALLSTLLEILSYMLRFDEEAMAHWKAAQMYSELYRKCQFFYANYEEASIDVWKEKLLEISEELSRISSLSPAVSTESYLNWEKFSKSKKYPTHRAIKDLKVGEIDDIISLIQNTLKEYRIEIFLFGSYFTSMHFNDIDIAVIVHEEEATIPLKEKMNEIETKYSKNGLDLDITIISEKDIIANRCTQFIKNICDGECYYKSPEVKKSIREYSGAVTNFKEMVDYFEMKAEESKNDYRDFVSNAFYMYYHALTAVLQNEKISWYGEKSMLTECGFLNDDAALKKYNIDSEKLSILLNHARLFFDEKDTAYLKTNINQENLSKLLEYFSADKKTINGIIGCIYNT